MMDPDTLRLIVVTDRRLAGARGVVAVVAAALQAGAPTIQLREKEQGAGEVLPLARELRALTREHDALFFVNDRVDLALAVEADGVHLGPLDLPVGEVRASVPPGFLIGYSTDDPDDARRAVSAGADYLGCGTVWPTSSKEDAGRVIGVEGLDRVARSVPIPVVGIGGVTPRRAEELRGTAAAGIAVVGAVMAAPDPAEATRQLLVSFRGTPPS
jgi:thiamine-phosphate pyrophosphorylase